MNEEETGAVRLTRLGGGRDISRCYECGLTARSERGDFSISGMFVGPFFLSHARFLDDGSEMR